MPFLHEFWSPKVQIHFHDHPIMKNIRTIENSHDNMVDRSFNMIYAFTDNHLQFVVLTLISVGVPEPCPNPYPLIPNLPA